MQTDAEIAAYHDSLAVRDAPITIKLSSVLLDEIKQAAEKMGIEPENWVVMTLEEVLAKTRLKD